MFHIANSNIDAKNKINTEKKETIENKKPVSEAFPCEECEFPAKSKAESEASC